MRTSLVLVGLLALACNKGGATAEAPPETVVETSSRIDITPDKPASEGVSTPTPTDSAAMPPSAAALQELLGARHEGDLPGRDALDAHEAPDAALAWLAEHGATAALRVRAVRALGLYPEADHDQLLSAYAGEGAPHPMIRAAALDAIAAFPVERRAGFQAVIEAGRGSGDPRVVAAAEAASEGM